MDWLREILSRLGAPSSGKRLDHDADDELYAHLDLAIEENLRTRHEPERGTTAALCAFGGLTQIKETYRVQRTIPS